MLQRINKIVTVSHDKSFLQIMHYAEIQSELQGLHNDHMYNLTTVISTLN